MVSANADCSPCRYKVLQSSSETTNNDDFALSVLHGLSDSPKHLSSRYLYDDQGSKLFQKIMDLPEYYLTRSEFEIFSTQGANIVAALNNEPLDFVELGSGDGSKTVLLLKEFLQAGFDTTYVPIDISEQAMKDLVAKLEVELPELNCRGLVGDYFHGLNNLGRMSTRRKLVSFLGANIGNFQPAAVRTFLQSLWYSLNDGDYFLIGADLRKDIRRMQSAYWDSAGVTAEFNLNLLRRINRELGADFNLDKFQFEAVFNVKTSAVESFLTAKAKMTVRIPEIHRSFEFEAGESIHTESSYKYRISDLEALARNCGFEVISHYFDSEKNFVDSLWRVSKSC